MISIDSSNQIKNDNSLTVLLTVAAIISANLRGFQDQYLKSALNNLLLGKHQPMILQRIDLSLSLLQKKRITIADYSLVAGTGFISALRFGKVQNGKRPKKLRLLCNLIFSFVLKTMQASLDPKIKTP